MKTIHFRIRTLVLGLLVTTNLLTLHAQNTDPEIHGQAIPEFSLYDLEGNLVTSESYKGQFLIIHIATTWCPYCNAEAPHLEAISQEYQDKNVKVLIIDVREPATLVDEKLRQRFNLTFPVLLDPEGTVAGSFAPEHILPELARDEIMLASNILVDPAGKIQFFSLLDTRNFDSKLIHLKSRLHELLDNK